MADDKNGFPVGNQDPNKRGFGKRPERDSGGSGKGSGDKPPRGEKPGRGDVTK